jgi:hypothetical protein
MLLPTIRRATKTRRNAFLDMRNGSNAKPKPAR